MSGEVLALGKWSASLCQLTDSAGQRCLLPRLHQWEHSNVATYLLGLGADINRANNKGKHFLTRRGEEGT